MYETLCGVYKKRKSLPYDDERDNPGLYDNENEDYNQAAKLRVKG